MIESEESLHFLDYWRVIRSRKEIVIGVSLLIIAVGILITYSLPKVYKTSTVIQVKEDQPDLSVFSGSAIRFNPLFLRTQFEIIQSRPIVEEAIIKRGLYKKFSKAFGLESLSPQKLSDWTYKMIKRGLNVQQYRDTNLIEIELRMKSLGSDSGPDSTPKEVAELVDSIAEVYKNERMGKSRALTEVALKSLYDSLTEQNHKVSDLAKIVDDIRDKYKIDIISSNYGSDSELSKMSLTRIEDVRIKARMELVDKETLYNKVKTLSASELLDAAWYLVQDPALADLISKKRTVEMDRQNLLESYGPQHPNVLKTTAVIKELDLKISEALKGMKTGIQAGYEAAKAKYDTVNTELEAMKASERAAESGGYQEFQKAKENLERATKIRDALEIRYAQEKIELRIPQSTVTVVEPAKVPSLDDPSSPKFALNIILSIVFGITAGIGLAYFVEYLDTSVKTIDDVERYMQLPVIGVIPQKVKAFTDPTADKAAAEAYRVLRTNLQFSKNMIHGKSICCTSGSVGEGKSLTTFNLAYVCAEFGERVLIVDADLHRPRQHKMLGLSNKMGLANVLVGDLQLEDAILATDVPNLDILTSGRISAQPHGLLDSIKMKDIVGRLSENYDVIFYDAPPIIGVSDTSLIVRDMEAVILVIQHRKYPRSVSGRAKSMILNMGANLVGVVMNNINVSRDYSYYYYSSHYNAYLSDGSKKKKS